MTEISRKKITFDFDNDNRPMREDVAEGTLFEPQYKQALRQIDNYLYELRLEKTELKDRDNSEKSRTPSIFLMTLTITTIFSHS